MRTLLREVMTRERAPRVPEPDLVMDDPEKVAAFTRAGREDGVMAPVYLFHCAHVCEIVRPGDTVVDLGCGPATQLGMIAKLNPEARFIGVDYSDGMLDRARTHVDELGARNVTFEKADMAELDLFQDKSVDAVFSTMALHHLANVDHLNRVLAETRRILKDDGGIYLVDFGHLKSQKSIQYFAYQYADRQPELFTLDYLYSLRAAFSLADFRKGVAMNLEGRAKVYATFLAPFMVAVKSTPRQAVAVPVRAALRDMRSALPAHHQTDINDLVSWFRPSGLRSRLLAS